MQRKLTIVVIAAALAAAITFAFASPPATQPGAAAPATPRALRSLIAEADKLRSADPGRYMAIIQDLEQNSSRATAQEREQIRYLQAYAAGAYRDDVAGGVRIATDLANESRNPTIRYRAYGLAATFSSFRRDFRTGLRSLNAAMEIRKSVPDRDIRNEGIGAAGVLYNQVGQHDIALRYVDELLASSPNPRAACGARYVQTDALWALEKIGKDLSGVESAIASCDAIKEVIFANLIRLVYAQALAANGDVEAGIKVLEDAMPQVEASRYQLLIAETHAVLGRLKLDAGDIPAAERHASTSISMSAQLPTSVTLVSAYYTLFKIAEERKGPVDALRLYQRFADARRAHEGDVKARELAYEIVRHETQQKTQQIQLLERNNQVLRLQQNLERESAQKARLAMVFLTLLLIGVVLWVIHMRRHQSALRRLAQTDSLTGIANRHHFTQMAEKSLVDCARAGEPASLVMFDLDHFKAINDTYGHGAGDWVLRQVGRICASHCRKIDYIGRLGGEEFAVLLHGLDLPAASRLAEDCRARLAQIDTRESGYVFVVTASFGVTSSAQSGYDLSRLLSHADQMLYRAKHEGRNRVSVYSVEAAESNKAKRTPALTVVNT